MLQWLLRVWVCVGLMVFSATAPCLAQSTDQPLMGSEATTDLPTGLVEAAPAIAEDELAGAGEDQIFRVLVVGDGLAGGMGAGVSRMSEERPGIEIVNRFNELSGLARPEFYDWATALPKITLAKPYDAAILMLGTNDRQAIRIGDAVHEFGSPEWRSFYAAQVDRMLDVLKGQGLRVYWVGLPPMADPAFDVDMKVIAEIQQQHVTGRGGVFIDIRPYFVGADGNYVERGLDDIGEDRKLRARDGVAFMKQGNNRLGQVVLEAVLKAEAGGLPKLPVAAPIVVAIAPTLVPVVIPDEVAPQLGPLFGQQGSNGEDIAFDATGVVPVKPRLSVVQQNKPLVPVQVQPRLQIVAAQGTAAEKLFTTGEAGPAPTGRFDDDRYIAPAP